MAHVRKMYGVAGVIGNVSVAPTPLIGSLKLTVPAKRHTKNKLHVALTCTYKDISENDAFKRYSIVANRATRSTMNLYGVFGVTVLGSGLWWQVDDPTVRNFPISSFPRVWISNRFEWSTTIQ
jgi:hypothetical protein